MGRMMICDFSDAQRLDLFPTDPLPRFSEQTPTTLAELKAVLAGDRERGYAVSQSFFERGVSSVAAPVRDGMGHIVAVINITAVEIGRESGREIVGQYVKISEADVTLKKKT